MQQSGDHVHEERVVQNVNLEYREAIYKVTQFIWLLFGGLEALIGIRVILMLIGANPANPFTALVYQFSELFLWPFRISSSTLLLETCPGDHIPDCDDCVSTHRLGDRAVDLGALLPDTHQPGDHLSPRITLVSREVCPTR